jgi:ectoine hydroxylase-related dioxygenase (phytanoyl-CoA dioxygenase family)
MSPVTETADVQAVLRDLDELGYSVVPDVLSPDELTSVRDALDRECAADDAAGTAIRYGPDNANQRIWALLNHGEEFIVLGMHPLALEIVRAAMGPDVLLAQLSANVTAPGADHEIGRLHTDQGFLPQPIPQMLVLNVAWFLDDFTEENGATLVVPGSHKLGTDASMEAEPVTPAQAIGPAGSMGVLDGRLHHATGLNRTTDKVRRGVFGTYSPPYIRSQENWSRSIDPEVVERHPELARRIGFEVWKTLGLVKGPEVAFNA